MNHPTVKHSLTQATHGTPDPALHRLHDRKAELKCAINCVLHFLLPGQNRRLASGSDRRQTQLASTKGKIGRRHAERRLPPHQRLREHRKELARLLQREMSLREPTEREIRSS